MRRRSLFRSFVGWFQGKPRHTPGTVAFFGPQDPAPPATAKAEKGACPPARRRLHIGSRRARVEPLEDRRLLAAILYVNDDATGLNTGASWADAYTDLQSALAAATSGDEVWVAGGTYKPTTGTDRSISFNLKDGVALYGGFAATESSRDQRDWTTNVTTLSGDIGIPGTETDNSIHVVHAADLSSATLDGFTIAAGYAEGQTPQGGGMLSTDCALTLVNLVFNANRAYVESHDWNQPTVYGGGAYISGGEANLSSITFSSNSAVSVYGQACGGGLAISAESATLTHVDFSGNSTNYCGGGMYCTGPDLTLREVVFWGNEAGDGGGLYSRVDSPKLTNVTFTENAATWSGGAVFNQSRSEAILTNAVFLGNTAKLDGGALRNDSTSVTLTNATFAGNSSPSAGGAIYSYALPGEECLVTLVNCIVWDNGDVPITGGTNTISYSIVQGGFAGDGNLDVDPQFVDAAHGDLHVNRGSPAIDAGTSIGAPTADLDRRQRPLDGDGDGVAGFDLGAYEKPPNQPPVAKAGGSYTVVIDHTVALTGAASQDADGTIALYEWDFDYDGTTFNADATGASPTFSAVGLEPGDLRTVALRVTDNNGAVSAIDTATLTAFAPRFTAGLFDPSASTFYLRCANITGMADYTFAYGQTDAGWKTLVGDWDGDDTSGVGLYDPNSSTFYLTNAYESGYAQYTFGYGEGGKGWIPLVGDWNGDGRSGVGLYDPQTSTFYLTNSLTTGVAEYTFGFGEANAGWTPLVGDWNGDGRTGVGLFNPHASTFYLTSTFQTGFAEHTFGYGEPDAGWQPLVGDWNGDHTDGVGLFAPKSSTFYLTDAFTGGYAQYAFGYGEPDAGWIPLVGDWDGRGASGVGLYCPATSTFYLTATLASGYAEYTVGFGQPEANWQPLVGCWTTASSQGQTYRAQAVDQLDLADLAADALKGVDAGWGV
jgi:predicted outer membrane repeat protein